MDFSTNENDQIVVLNTNLSPSFQLQWQSQVDSIFTFFSEYSVTILFLKCFRSIETTKLRVTIVVHQLHESILHVTKRDVRSSDRIVPNVPKSLKNPKMI